MDKDQAVRFGKWLRERRQAVGMSTHELGERIGARNSTIIRIEQGAFAAPRPDKLARIAEALGISLADMYGHAGYAVPDDLFALAEHVMLHRMRLTYEALARGRSGEQVLQELMDPITGAV